MTVQTTDPVRRQRRTDRPAGEVPPTAVGQTAKTVVLSLVVLAVVFPLWSVAVTSLSSRRTINETGGMVVIPRDLDVSAYATIFSGGQVANAVWVSTLISVVGAALSWGAVRSMLIPPTVTLAGLPALSVAEPVTDWSAPSSVRV